MTKKNKLENFINSTSSKRRKSGRYKLNSKKRSLNTKKLVSKLFNNFNKK